MPISSLENTNSWGASASAYDDAPLNAVNPIQAKLKSPRIPEDWDNDDEEEETDSHEIWEIPNTNSPIPQLIIPRPTAPSTIVSPPPQPIIQPPMRILKRPTQTTTPPSNSSASPSPVPQTIAEREAKYQEARERIFGYSKQDDVESETQSPKPVPNMNRDSTAPEVSASGSNPNASQGFGGKRGRRPPKS